MGKEKRQGAYFKITPNPSGRMNPGDVACCPLVSNVGTWDEVKDKHHDWELSECPECGAGIWLSTIAVALIREGGRYACTKCALQGAAGGTAEDLIRIRKEHGHG